MIKRSFFGLAKPTLTLPVFASDRQLEIETVPLPPKATLFLDPGLFSRKEPLIQVGEGVRTGQKVRIGEDGDYVISPVTGTVSALSKHTGYLGRTFRTISIDVAKEDQWDQEFPVAGGAPSRDSALRFLGSLPGARDFGAFLDPGHSLHTVVISALDQDLLVETSRSVAKHQGPAIKDGIAILKSIRPAKRYILVVPPDLIAVTGQSGAEGRIIEPVYPNTLPRMMMKRILGKEVPAGKGCEEAGIGFIGVEAVAALGRAYKERVLPVDKVMTVIQKDHRVRVVKARIGTPVGAILGALNMETGHGDRLVFGGPMRGQTVFSEDMPVLPDTDAIMIQDREEIVSYADTHCVNCGECVRICPARVPVNMLIRFLENGLFEEAAESCDLFSCIECGLCSFVCIARIPIFQYIMLGKYEFDRMKGVEESHA